MQIKSDFKAKINIKTIMKRIFMSVLAEEVPPVVETPEATPKVEDTPKDTEPQKQVNFEDLISKARKEEKDKLYPQIGTLKKDIETLTEKLNENLLTIEARNIKIKELEETIENLRSNSNKNDDEVVKGLKSDIKDLKKQIATLEKEKGDIVEVENRIKDEYEVKLYREQKLREGGQEIIPELVTGVTKEDIDNSFEVAKQRYNDIIKNVISSTTSSKVPVGNVKSGQSVKDFDTKDIANMSPTEWAEKRKLLGLK